MSRTWGGAVNVGRTDLEKLAADDMIQPAGRLTESALIRYRNGRRSIKFRLAFGPAPTE